ncbi:hypothetical protein HanPSC8_Chr04g0175171 [Helianthus annuus]|nr:hypothetical protein HanPSC8_Chr04g0175171 [Helianthus annuus]
MAEEESVQVEESPLPILKWDQGLFEHITKGFQFPPEWNARYPRQGQTAVDALPGYITLFEDFFLQGNFQLPATEFMASILHFYGFHISQMSPTGMVRVRHFEFLCRSQGMEPTVEKFWAFYQLIRNIGFYSFGNRGAAKKILISSPKSFHDWKMKFFFIREEVIPIAMIFRESDKIDKEELPIPKGADWYLKLLATPNRIFGENVLVAAHISDKWPENSEEVSVLRFNDKGMLSPFIFSCNLLAPNCWFFYDKGARFQAVFPTFGGSMGVHPLRSGEPYWYEQIKGNFLYPPAGVFANLHPQPKERAKKAPTKKKTKKVTVDTGVTSKKGGSSRAAATTQDKGTLQFWQSNLEDYVVASDSLEGLSRIGEKKKSCAGSKSSRSAGSSIPEAGATPSSIALDEEEEEEHEEEAAAKLVSRKSVGAYVCRLRLVSSLVLY